MASEAGAPLDPLAASADSYRWPVAADYHSPGPVNQMGDPDPESPVG